MKDLSYWEQFMATGKIEDFLAYKNAERQQETGAAKEYSHAGDHRDHRDGLKG